jgi:hypothetical protein
MPQTLEQRTCQGTACGKIGHRLFSPWLKVNGIPDWRIPMRIHLEFH